MNLARTTAFVLCAALAGESARAQAPAAAETPDDVEARVLYETAVRLRAEGKADAIFIGRPFPTATGKDAIVALYADFLSKRDFNVEFEILEIDGAWKFYRYIFNPEV